MTRKKYYYIINSKMFPVKIAAAVFVFLLICMFLYRKIETINKEVVETYQKLNEEIDNENFENL